MDDEKKDDDLDLFKQYARVIEGSRNSEGDQVDGQVHFHVMPEKIIMEIRARIADVERYIGFCDCCIHSPYGAVGRENEYVQEKARLIKLRDCYEEMILRFLEACLKK